MIEKDMTEHSPDTWRFKGLEPQSGIKAEHGVVIGAPFSDPKRPGVVVHPTIAHVFGQTSEERAANSTLIASALDLLEALETALPWLDAAGFEVAADQARAAIDKARRASLPIRP